MGDVVEIEVEARPGTVVLRLSNPEGAVEYPISPASAEQFAAKIAEGAERAREL